MRKFKEKKYLAVFVSCSTELTDCNLSQVDIEYFRSHAAVSNAQYVWFHKCAKSVQPEKYGEM